MFPATAGSRLSHFGKTERDYQSYYYFLGSLGRKVKWLAVHLLQSVLRVVNPGERFLFAIDDTPTKRYGPHVEGAGIHHNPTPGPADQKYLYGHVWVTLSLVVRHALWGTIGLPLLAFLYVRQMDIKKIPSSYKVRFQTKLEQAAALVEWLALWLKNYGKRLWVVVDGAYAKKPFLQRATWPKVRWLAVVQALTRCKAPSLPLAEPRRLLPSMAICSIGSASLSACIHSRKHAWNASGCKRSKTRSKVSWEGMPLGSSRKRRSQSRRYRNLCFPGDLGYDKDNRSGVFLFAETAHHLADGNGYQLPAGNCERLRKRHSPSYAWSATANCSGKSICPVRNTRESGQRSPPAANRHSRR